MHLPIHFWYTETGLHFSHFCFLKHFIRLLLWLCFFVAILICEKYIYIYLCSNLHVALWKIYLWPNSRTFGVKTFPNKSRTFRIFDKLHKDTHNYTSAQVHKCTLKYTSTPTQVHLTHISWQNLYHALLIPCAPDIGVHQLSQKMIQFCTEDISRKQDTYAMLQNGY